MCGSQTRPIGYLHEFGRYLRVLSFQAAPPGADMKVVPPARRPSEGLVSSIRSEGLEDRARDQEVRYDGKECSHPGLRRFVVLVIEYHLAGRAAGRQIDFEEPQMCGTDAHVVTSRQSSEFSNVTADGGRARVPSRRVQIHPQLDLLDKEVDPLDIGSVDTCLFVGHPHGQSGCLHEKFGDVVLQSAAPEAGPTRGTVGPVRDPLAGGGDPLMAVPTTPQDAILTSRRRRVNVANRDGQIVDELGHQVWTGVSQSSGPCPLLKRQLPEAQRGAWRASRAVDRPIGDRGLPFVMASTATPETSPPRSQGESVHGARRPAPAHVLHELGRQVRAQGGDASLVSAERPTVQSPLLGQSSDVTPGQAVSLRNPGGRQSGEEQCLEAIPVELLFGVRELGERYSSGSWSFRR